jgi:hypothetical protein
MAEERIPDAYIIGVIVCRSMTSMDESIMKGDRRGRLRYTPEQRSHASQRDILIQMLCQFLGEARTSTGSRNSIGA